MKKTRQTTKSFQMSENSSWLLFVIDFIIYVIAAVVLIFIHPSFDYKFSTTTVLMQSVNGLILIFGCRWIAKVYKEKWQFGQVKAFLRLAVSDILAGILFAALQKLMGAKGIEVVLAFLVSAVTLIGAVLVRIAFRLLYDASLEFTMEIPFSPPDIGEQEIYEVSEALRSGWITTGPRTKRLEKLLANYMGTPKAVCLNSQTACGEMALRLLGIGPGDEVITCAYTYTATASVVCHVGAKLVLVDCSKEPGTIEMDYTALEKAITKNTKAIIPVDLAGIPCNYDKIFEVVEKKKNLFQPSNDLQKAIGRVAVITDAAHALGASWHNRMVGSIGDFSNFSFHAVKNFTTAEGGCMTWRHIDGVDDEELYKKAMLYSLHGQSKDALAKTKVGAWEYDVIGTWYKSNMTDIQAALGLVQFERYPGMLRRRREIIEKYDAALKPLGVEVLNHYEEGSFGHESSGHLYLTRIPNITPDQRNEIITRMAEEGVSCNVHYKPLPLLTAYKNLGFDIKDYPNAYAKFANEVSLPLYTKLTDEEVDYAITTYVKVLKEYL